MHLLYVRFILQDCISPGKLIVKNLRHFNLIPLDMKGETYGNAGFCPAPHSTFSEKEHSNFLQLWYPTSIPEGLENYTLKQQMKLIHDVQN